MAILTYCYASYKKSEILDYLLIGSDILFSREEVYLK